MTKSHAIAIVGLSCRYPGSRDARELWENVLASRRQFRRIPDCRFPLADYYDPHARDKTYATRVAVMDWQEFDWEAHGISRSTYESTDSVHWLALQVAIEAVADAGYSRETLPKQRTGVILGNTLCGEETRTWGIRLRWPFIARALHEAAARSGISGGAATRIVDEAESVIKSVFPKLTEDSLSGSMASTIAGRIASYYDLDGGGYVVDGACSSSLLAVATAAERLTRGELDMAVVGGVDISLDPLELIGFSGAGALTRGDMNVYDRRASGFLPGEGCGVVLLKRLEDAERDGDAVHAVLRGWGISSDGRGAIAAPNSIGQSKAILRAYENAGYAPRDLDFVEGHGTGTPVGDRAELEAVYSALRTDRDTTPTSCGITSLKSLVGHTKAAAGIGGLIKTIIAVNQRVLPPTAGCTSPHVLFEVTAPRLYPLTRGEVRPEDSVVRAGVSAMGFGGINCHLTLESHGPKDPRFKNELDEELLFYSSQETEVFLFGADSRDGLLARLAAVREDAIGASLAELTDLSAELAQALEGTSPTFRAAVVAHTPDALVSGIDKARAAITDATGDVINHASVDRRVLVRTVEGKGRIGMVFPGQGAQQINVGQFLVKRLPWARALLERADAWMEEIGAPHISPLMFRPIARARKEDLDRWRAELTETSVAQPAICFGSLLFAKFLGDLGLEPSAVAGHSLGELSAFAMAGAFDEEALIKLAALRGRAMSGAEGEAGTMASLMCSSERAAEILAKVSGYVVVANINTPAQTVISGEVPAVEEAVRLAEAEGISAKRLPVSNAFHSRMVAGAAAFLREHSPVKGAPQALERPVISGMTGSPVAPDVELSSYFADQVLARVDYVSAIRAMNACCDLLLEVGPGRVLSGMAADVLGPEGAMCLPVESTGGSDRDLNTALAGVFVHGHDLRWSALFEGRLVRPFVPVRDRSFFVNPCERPYAPSTRAPDTFPPAIIETPWAKSLGVPASFLQDYLDERGDVLSALIRADINRLAAAEAEAVPETFLSVPREDPPQILAADEEVEDLEVSEESSEEAGDGYSDTFMEWHPSGPARQNTEIEDSIIEVIAGRMECHPRSISPEARLMDDLRLDAAEADELVRFAAEFSEVEGLVETSRYLNATIREVAGAVRRARQHRVSAASPADSQNMAAPPHAPAGLPDWVRSFEARVLEPSPRADSEADRSAEDWDASRVLILADAEDGDPVAAHLARALADLGALVHILPYSAKDAVGRGRFSHTFAILPRLSAAPAHSVSARDLATVVDRLRAAAYVSSGPNRFPRKRSNALTLIEVGEGLAGGTAAFGATLHLERPEHRVRVLELDASLAPELIAERAIREVEAEGSFSVASYDGTGARFEPKCRVQNRADYAPRSVEWSERDVVWVTGGARGRTAECALAFARATGVRLALVDRTGHPVDERSRTVEIRRNLQRFSEAGVTARYYECEVSDFESVREVAQRATAELGAITAVLHGVDDAAPGPSAERHSREGACSGLSSPVLGAAHVMRALEGRSLKLFVASTSLVGVTGLPGAAWPALANALTGSLLRAFSQATGTPTLALAFGPWFELAPAEKPRHAAISPAEGAARFMELMTKDPGCPEVVVTTRPFGFDTWRTARPKASGAAVSRREGPAFEEGKDPGALVCEEPGVDVVLRWKPMSDAPAPTPGIWLDENMTRVRLAAARLAGTVGLDIQNLALETLQLHRQLDLEAERESEVQVSVVLEETEVGESPRMSARLTTSTSAFKGELVSATYVSSSGARVLARSTIEALVEGWGAPGGREVDDGGARATRLGAIPPVVSSWPMLERDTAAGRALQFASHLGFTEQLASLIVPQIEAQLAAEGPRDSEPWTTRGVELSVLELVRPGEVVEGEIRVAGTPSTGSALDLWADFVSVNQSGRRELVARAKVQLARRLRKEKDAWTSARVAASREVEIEASSPHGQLEQLGIWMARVRDRFLHQVAPQCMSATQGAGLFCERAEIEPLRDLGELRVDERVRVELVVAGIEEKRILLEARYVRLAEDGAAEEIARARQALVWRSAHDGAHLPLPDGVARALHEVNQPSGADESSAPRSRAQGL